MTPHRHTIYCNGQRQTTKQTQLFQQYQSGMPRGIEERRMQHKVPGCGGRYRKLRHHPVLVLMAAMPERRQPP